jgi:hypothetical protein
VYVILLANRHYFLEILCSQCDERLHLIYHVTLDLELLALGLPARQFSFMFLPDDSFMSFAVVVLNPIRNISLSQSSGLLQVCLRDDFFFMFLPDVFRGFSCFLSQSEKEHHCVSLSEILRVCLQHKILFRFLPDNSFMVSAACLFSSMMF